MDSLQIHFREMPGSEAIEAKIRDGVADPCAGRALLVGCMRNRKKCLFAFAVALVLAPVITAGTGTGIQEIDYYHRVSDWVAMGGQPTPAQVVALAQAGFVSIINLREESELDGQPEAVAAKDAGLRYIALPVATTSPTDEQEKACLLATGEAEIYPVFIHCATANRSAALWMVRRALLDGWSLEEAEKEADQNGLTSEPLRKFAREYVQGHVRKEGP